MTKKRKGCSPTQESPSDRFAELKAFMERENAKEIKEYNDKRMSALEESLSFALDSMTAGVKEWSGVTRSDVECRPTHRIW